MPILRDARGRVRHDSASSSARRAPRPAPPLARGLTVPLSLARFLASPLLLARRLARLLAIPRLPFRFLVVLRLPARNLARPLLLARSLARPQLLAICLLALVFPARARAGTPPTAPILRIETGMHTDTIRRIGVDAAGRYLVTGSVDKTVRVWDLATGALLRTLRPPIGAGAEGRIYAVAISPDGRLVAAGGWTGFDWDQGNNIYLFDRASGDLVRRLAGLPNVVNHLVFSPDGGRLAAVLGAGGLRVFAVDSGRELGSDSDYGGSAYGVDFDRSGRLVTSCYDGRLRLYDAKLHRLARVTAPGGNRPHSVRFAPDGKKIAVGYEDSARVDVLSASTLQPMYQPHVSDPSDGNLSAVAWSADGTWLCAGGTYDDGSGNSPVRCWADAGRGRLQDEPGALLGIMDLAALPGGGLAFGGADPIWGVLIQDGGRTPLVPSAVADFRGLEEAFRLDRAGVRARFAYRVRGVEPAEFSLSARSLTLDPPAEAGLEPPQLEAPGLIVADWRHTREPTLNGTPLQLQKYEMSRAVAVASDGKSFLLGADWTLYAFDRPGHLRWQVPAPAVTWAVNLSADGRLAVAAFGDGTIRWYRASDGQELLAFFPHADHRRWVAWTPSGYYDASPGGEDLIGWHVNRGPDQAADFFPASQFRDRFYRPDVVARILATLDETQAVAAADAATGRTTRDTPFSRLLPPVVTLLEPREDTSVSTSAITLEVAVRSPSGEPVSRVWALVDGRQADGTRGILVAPSSGDPSPGGTAPGPAPDGQVYTLTVPLPSRDCTVSVLAETAWATGEPVALHVRRAPDQPAPLEPDLRPNLYVLAVGVGAYATPGWRLDFAAADARAFADTLKAQQGRLYKQVNVRLLTDRDATKDAILDGLEWLQRQTTARDVAVMFFAGHGVNEPSTGRYHFLPINADFDAFKRTMLPDTDVRNTLAAISGKVVFFLDSCHSGNLMTEWKGRAMPDINRVINELASAANGVVVFSASTADQQSQESVAWGHGAFTLAVVEGLEGRADPRQTTRITINMLDLYVSERVKALTAGIQTPSTMKPASVPDFPLALSP